MTVNHLGIIMNAVYEIIIKRGVCTNADLHHALGNMPNWIIDEAIEKLEKNHHIEDLSIAHCDSDYLPISKQWGKRPAD